MVRISPIKEMELCKDLRDGRELVRGCLWEELFSQSDKLGQTHCGRDAPCMLKNSQEVLEQIERERY